MWWVCGREGLAGLCQERAYVTGLEAANTLARSGALGPYAPRQHPVIPIWPDEPQANRAPTAQPPSHIARHA